MFLPLKRSKSFKLLLLVLLVAAVTNTGRATVSADSAANSSWVHFGPDGKLVYQTDSSGNRIMDFSSAGYMGGGVAIPNIPVVKTIAPSGGDDTAALQSAIDELAAMPLANGSRGALLLAPGTFNASTQLNITASGIVVRGSGSGSDGTVIQMNGSPFLLFNAAGSGSYVTSNSVNMTDSFVPSGTDTFTVDSTSGFSVGDTVLVTRTVTADWIHYMGMDTLVRNGQPQTWLAPGSKINTDRIIKSISGNKITLDGPLTDSFDSAYLGSPVGTLAKYSFPGRISQVGLESFKVQAPPVVAAYRAVSMSAVIDSWVRDIVIQDGVNNFSIDRNSKRITVDNVIINHTISSTDTAAPADFTCTGTQILFNKAQANDLQQAGKGSWAVVTQSQGAGPIVVLNFTSTEQNGVAPHQRWTTGILVDHSQFSNAANNTLGIAFQNRGTSGSGHGWPMGWSVAWNVTAPNILVSQAPGTINWCIGCVGSKVSAKDPEGTYDSFGTNVTPLSLYLAQLKERLGPAALANIGYPPPTLHVPEDKTVEATGMMTGVEIGSATSEAGVIVTNDAPAAFPLGKTNVTWTATDKYGLTTAAIQVINVADKTKPVITITSPLAQEYKTSDKVTVTYDVYDTLSGVESSTAVLNGKPVANGDTVSLAAMAGSNTFEVTAKDKAGNIEVKNVVFDVKILAKIEITPKTLSLKSKGGDDSMKATIEFPAGYDVTRINPATVQMNVNGTFIHAQIKPGETEEEDQGNSKKVKMKFDRQQVIKALGNSSGRVNLPVTGQLSDGKGFTGSGSIDVIN